MICLPSHADEASGFDPASSVTEPVTSLLNSPNTFFFLQIIIPYLPPSQIAVGSISWVLAVGNTDDSAHAYVDGPSCSINVGPGEIQQCNGQLSFSAWQDPSTTLSFAIQNRALVTDTSYQFSITFQCTNATVNDNGGPMDNFSACSSITQYASGFYSPAVVLRAPVASSPAAIGINGCKGNTSFYPMCWNGQQPSAVPPSCSNAPNGALCYDCGSVCSPPSH